MPRRSDTAHRRPGQVLGTAAALALLGAILVVAARTDAAPAGARDNRRLQLVELIRAEQARAQRLEQQVTQLTNELVAVERALSDDAKVSRRLQRSIDGIEARAHLTAVRGPGVEVELRDSTLATSPSGDLNDLVIHEQDLQAVINALWAGGAEAMTVNGQRILATTAIRCVGNTLLLHGAVYSPPYVVRAVGEEASLRAALAADPVVAALQAAVPQYGLGFAVTSRAVLQLPAYNGSSPVKIAEPLPTGA